MLKLNVTPPTLVIAGAWNPDILTPNWVALNALGLQLDQNFTVKVDLPIGNPTQRPTFEFHGIRYIAAKNTLTFFLLPDAVGPVDKSITAATKILDLLSHTPITGFGFNFSYVIEEPSEALLKTFSSCDIPASFVNDDAAITVRREWKASVKTHDSLLNVSTELEGDTIRVIFNVHFEVANAEAASKKLQTANLFPNVENNIIAIATRIHTLGEEA